MKGLFIDDEGDHYGSGLIVAIMAASALSPGPRDPGVPPMLALALKSTPRPLASSKRRLGSVLTPVAMLIQQAERREVMVAGRYRSFEQGHSTVLVATNEMT